MRAYLTVWRLPSAPVLLLSGFAGRLPSAMVPLALLLMVQQQTGSYAVAGLASATLGIASAVMAPVLGRLADRRGPRPVLFTQAAVYPLLLALLDRRRPRGCVRRRDRSRAAALAGTATPLVSGTRAGAVVAGRRPGPPDGVRARRHRDRARVRRRPVAGRRPRRVRVARRWRWCWPASSPSGARSASPRPRHPPLRARRRRPVRAVLHRADTRDAAAAAQRHGADAGLRRARGRDPGVRRLRGLAGPVGLLLALWALGSVVGGLWFGARVLSISLPRQYRLLLLGVTIGLAPLAWISSPWALGVLLFLGGTAIAPTLTVQNTLVGSMAPEHATTEAFTWLSTITVGASAIGAAVGGALIEGPPGSAAASCWRPSVPRAPSS